jgi:hypothetical protein
VPLVSLMGESYALSLRRVPNAITPNPAGMRNLDGSGVLASIVIAVKASPELLALFGSMTVMLTR